MVSDIINIPDAPSDCISRVRFAPAPNLRHLLVTSWDAQLRLYDASAYKLLAMHKKGGPLLDCTFADTCAISVGLDKRVSSYDYAAQQEFCLGQHDDAIRCVEFDPNLRQIVTGSWDRTIRLWDVRREGSSILHLGTKVFALDICGVRIVAAGADRHLYIYDSRRLDMPIKRESLLKHQLRALKVSADQQATASGSTEGRVAIEYFDQDENNQSQYTFKCHRTKAPSGEEQIHFVNTISFHPLGTFATGGSDGGVCLWDSHARKRLWRPLQFDASVSSLCFSGDGAMLVIGVSYDFAAGEEGLRKAPKPELVVKTVTEMEASPKSRS